MAVKEKIMSKQTQEAYEKLENRLIVLECKADIHADWEWRWDKVKVCLHCGAELPKDHE